jgi:predicted transcriptional regulator
MIPTTPASKPLRPARARSEHDSIARLTQPIELTVDREMTVEGLAMFLLHHQVTSAVVVDAAGSVLGFASMTDIVREHVIEGMSAETRVREIMMPFILSLPRGASIAHAAAIMAARDVHHLLVRAEDGSIVGLVHARDVLRWVAHKRGLVIPDDDRSEWRRSVRFAL